jgi:hemolysin activation/secretion protein
MGIVGGYCSRVVASHTWFAAISLVSVLWLVVLPCPFAYSQVLPPIIDPSGRSSQPPVPERQVPLKPVPSPEDILPQPPADGRNLSESPQPLGLRAFVKEIRIVGSTIFSDIELNRIKAPYENREVTTEDLEELRRQVTLLYVEKGYVNSGAVIPDQRVSDGVITLQVIEGVLKEIQIEGTTWFREGYIRDRIHLGTDPPFNMDSLRNRLQLMLQDPRLERLNAEVKPSTRPGEAILGVKVQEANPFKAWLEFNNYQTPVVGAERGLATIAHQNLTGHGDQAMFTYGRSRGVDPIIDTSYTIPFTAYDTTFTAGYRRNDFLVVESPFRPLDIKSQAEIFTLRLRQPLYHTLTDEVALAIEGERLFNKTTLLDTPFDFVPGTQNGVSNVSALRFIQEWTHRTSSSVFAIRSRVSLGIDVLGATINSGPVADGRYVAWLGQTNWVKRFESGIELLNRLDFQLANDRLFPLEQIAIGGRYSVRGYRENTLVRENAVLYSFEARFPLLRTASGGDLLQFCPFFDFGHGWAAKGPTADPQTLASVGAGLRLNLFDRGTANIYWGQMLNHIPAPGPGGNLQDHGVHVQIVFNVF